MRDMDMKWEGSVILLSIFIAFIGSYGIITLYEQYRLCSRENRPKVLTPNVILLMMAFCVGGVAIWCMHFVGMAAMSVYDMHGNKLPVSYRIDLTIASLIAVIVCCYAGLLIASSDRLFTEDKTDVIDKFIKNAREMTIQEIRAIKHKHILMFLTLFRGLTRIVLGGVLTAAGVCVMHYIGMEAMVVDCDIDWDAGVIAASVIIALVAASAAYWILFRLLALFPYMEILRVACAIIMSIAVNGMHYTGMAAAKFSYNPKSEHAPGVVTTATVDQMTAVYGAIVASMIFMWIIIMLSMADLRVWYYQLASLVRETDIRVIMNKAIPSKAEQPFMSEYEELRSIVGDPKALMAFKLRMKTNSSSNKESAESGQVYPLDGTATASSNAIDDPELDIKNKAAVYASNEP